LLLLGGAHGEPGAPDERFAVIVRGLGGDPAFERRFAEWTDRLCELLRERWRFRPENVFVLTPDGRGCSPNTARATADGVRRAFAWVRARSAPESVLLVVLIGHGSFDGERGYFNLVGPDLSAEDFRSLLLDVRARLLIFVNTASSSGAFLPVLSRPGTIVITATRSGREQQATVFAQYLLDAFTDARADADKDGRTSLAEAFAFAAKMTAEHYAQQGILATEHPLLDDDGDGVGHEAVGASEGQLARTVYLEAPVEIGADDEELRPLLRQRQALLEKIEALKARKAEMRPEEYERELERLALELARLTERINARRKKP
jgi:hypothetical protein